MSKQKMADEILAFWFSDRVRPLWFNSTSEFDQEIKNTFVTTYQLAASGQLKAWEETAQGALALVIVLDQFPLNMFRHKPQSFETEAIAREVTDRAIKLGFDQKLNDEQKAFLYLPLMHSENIADQDRSVALYQKAGLQDNLKFAHHHRDIIRRFGRFPHRNAVLARHSTEYELSYLESEQAFLG